MAWCNCNICDPKRFTRFLPGDTVGRADSYTAMAKSGHSAFSSPNTWFRFSAESGVSDLDL